MKAFRQVEASLRLSRLAIDSDAKRIFEWHISGELTLAGMGAYDRKFGTLTRVEGKQPC